MFWAVVALVLAWIYLRPDGPRPILGIYNQPGKWFYLKASFIYFSIILRKWQASRNKEPGKSDVGYGVGTGKDLKFMESAQPLSDSKFAIDAVLFSSSGRDGTYLVAAQARRKLMMTQTIFCMRIPGVGVLMHPKHPDTTMFTDTETSWHCEGLNLDLVEPMKKWTVRYEGPMVNQATGKTHHLDLKAEFTTDLPHFDFDSDMDPWAVARAFAKEPWSREYFDRIKAAHQNHYEQFGDIRGVATVDGVPHELDLNVMRDHTHGSSRDWRLMHRYGINNFRTKDGLRGFVGVVCQPSTFTSLEIGYVYTRSGECLPVQEVDLPLWRHGEAGAQQPTDFAFRFRAGDRWHNVQVQVLDSVEVMFGWEWEARVVERFARYTIDGVDGWGVSEWHWNTQHLGGRPKELEEKDPERVRGVDKYH